MSVPLKSTAPLGIVAALPHEIEQLIEQLEHDPQMRTIALGQREYYIGSLWERPCVITLARMGKVAAAATTTALIHEFGVRAVLFTGVAGALNPDLRIGDIVIASSLMQHDMDASPLFPRYSIPLLGRERFLSCPTLTQALMLAARRFAEDNLPALRSQQQWTLVQHTPKVQLGLIASGDQFIASDTARATLRAAVPEALAVEMEGAAVAQVCYEYGVPFAVMRVISDAAGTAANDSFATFLTEAASAYSYGVMRVLLHRYNS